MPLELRQTNKFGNLTKLLKKVEGSIAANKLLDRIGRALVAYIKHKFTGASQENNRSWAPLKPNTIAAKGHNRILVNSGLLWHSYEHKVIPGARVTVGTDVPWAKFHEFGTKGPYEIRPKKAAALSFVTTGGRIFARHVKHPGLPARPMLPSKAQAKLIAQAAVATAIKEALEK